MEKPLIKWIIECKSPFVKKRWIDKLPKRIDTHTMFKSEADAFIASFDIQSQDEGKDFWKSIFLEMNTSPDTWHLKYTELQP